jgi:hypothetical protein
MKPTEKQVCVLFTIQTEFFIVSLNRKKKMTAKMLVENQLSTGY